MFALMKHHEVSGFDDRLRDASAVTAELMSEILAEPAGALRRRPGPTSPRGSNA